MKAFDDMVEHYKRLGELYVSGASLVRECDGCGGVTSGSFLWRNECKCGESQNRLSYCPPGCLAIGGEKTL